MNPSSRRRFLAQMGAAGLGALAASCSSPGDGQAAAFDSPLGVQLYTLRNQIPSDPGGTLKAVAEIGFTQVEVLYDHIGLIEPYLAPNGLAAVSGHFPAPLVTGDWSAWGGQPGPPAPTWAEAVSVAQRLGLRCMGIAYLQQAERGTLDFYRRFADQMNQAGQTCRQAGIQLCYHHHAFEFEPIEGQKPFDLLVERFDPELVHWQFDVFWLTLAGLNPAETIRKFAGRVASLHLKDLAKGAAPRLQESQVAPEEFKAVGQGSVDFAAVLQAALGAEVGFYFVEQDHAPGNPLDSLRESYRYLRALAV